MSERPKFFEGAHSIAMYELKDEICMIDFEGERILLSFDAAYDLAIRLARFIQNASDREESHVEPRH